MLGQGNTKVQRKVIATLGELLFFIASQQVCLPDDKLYNQAMPSSAKIQDRAADAGSSIPAATIAAVASLLRPGTDETVQVGWYHLVPITSNPISTTFPATCSTWQCVPWRILPVREAGGRPASRWRAWLQTWRSLCRQASWTA